MEIERKFQNNGVNVVVELTPDEREAFRKAAQSVYEKYQDKVGKDTISMVDEINNKYK